MLARGRIDLTTEKIDFTFETTPREGIGISVGDIVNPFTKVVGTLSAPKISLDLQGTIVEGGTAFATLKAAAERDSRAPVRLQAGFALWQVTGDRSVAERIIGHGVRHR